MKTCAGCPSNSGRATRDGAAGGNLMAKAQSGRLTMSIFDKPLTMILAIVVVVAIVLLPQIVFR